MANSTRKCSWAWDNAHDNRDDHIGRHSCGGDAGHDGNHRCQWCGEEA